MTNPNNIGANVGSGIGANNATAKPLKRSSKTLVYAPRIRAIVSTADGPVEITDDIVNFQLRRVINAASQFSCVLNNRNQKYNGVLGRMDPIVVYLTRVKEQQAFSGFLDSVPGLTLYTSTCEIKATCTLKRLMNTWWDVNLSASQHLLDQKVWKTDNTKPEGSDVYNNGSDSGMGQMLGAVLTEVAGWDPNQIIIQNIPAKFLNLFTKVELSRERLDDIELIKRLLGITSVAGAGGTTGTTGTGSTSGTPSAGTAGTGVPATAINVGDYQENFESTDITAKFTGPYPPGDAVERWRPLAMLALQIMGIDPSVIEVMMHRIGVESTGDPNAINLTDSNAQAGHPSMGILQTIIGTFNSYAVPPYNNHIYSPLGSMLSSINYVNTDPKFHGTQIEKFNQAYGGTAGY